MILDTDLAWLAGIVEGEGSITMGLAKKTLTYNAMIHIVNTDRGLIDKCLQIMHSLGCTTSVIREVKNDRLGKKAIDRLQVSNYVSIILLLEAILPYMFSAKKTRAAKMLAFAHLRVIKGCGKGLTNAQRAYTVEEHQLASIIRAST